MNPKAFASPGVWMIAGLVALSACKPAAVKAPNDVPPGMEDSADRSKRVAAITAQLNRNGKLPGALTDAHFIEEKSGTGVLGPSDFFAYYALAIPVADIPAWEAALAKTPAASASSAYAAPRAGAPWWVTREEFARLKCHSPISLTGRSNGWAAITADGRVFVYAFTM